MHRSLRTPRGLAKASATKRSLLVARPRLLRSRVCYSEPRACDANCAHEKTRLRALRRYNLPFRTVNVFSCAASRAITALNEAAKTMREPPASDRTTRSNYVRSTCMYSARGVVTLGRRLARRRSNGRLARPFHAHAREAPETLRVEETWPRLTAVLLHGG